MGGALALALVRRFRRRWWLPGSAAVVAVGVITVWLFPVVIDPLFNKFEPLPRGPLRSQVLELARKADVDVGQVYRVDASRRTTGVNAYVNGLGHSKRVVLYDNLIEGLPRDQVLQVVAHELGHQHHRDLLRGLVWLALVAPAGTLLAQRLAERIGRREGLADPSRAPRTGRAARACPVGGDRVLRRRDRGQPALATRGGERGRVLARPDATTRRPTSRSSGRSPCATCRTPTRRACWNVLFGTHPTTVDRIGIGEAWAREH